MRKTPLVIKVQEILQNSNKPLSVADIQISLAEKNLVPNKTTLYRMFEKLKKEGIIESLLLDAKSTYYELKTNHHHHFRCDSCDEIKCITDPDLESQIHALEHKLEVKGLKIKHHHFSFSGKCASC